MRVVDDEELFAVRRFDDAVVPGAGDSLRAAQDGVAFELADLQRVFFDVGQQSAGRFAIEASSRNQEIMLLDFARPLCGIVLDPVVPFFYGRITCQTAARGFQAQRIGIKWLSVVTHASGPS